jgi:hypothetical protein
MASIEKSAIDRIDGLHRNIWAFALSLDGLSYPPGECFYGREISEAGFRASNLLAYIPRSGISAG